MSFDAGARDRQRRCVHRTGRVLKARELVALSRRLGYRSEELVEIIGQVS